MIHLHVHSDFSLLDGCGSQEAYIKRAIELGHRAIAFTDHGTMRGVWLQSKLCGEREIKPLYGVEIYLAADRRIKELDPELRAEILSKFPAKEQREAIFQAEIRFGIRPRYHLTLLAETDVGLINLFRLTSRGYVEGFAFKRPRVDLELVAEHADGVICLSGCPIGPIARELSEKQPRRALVNVDRLREIFDERLYVEIMPHEIEGLDVVNQGLIKIARNRGLPIVATQDAHYVRSTDWRAHEALLGINTGSPLLSPTRFKFSGRFYWFKSEAEMREGFRRQGIASDAVDESIRSTDEIGERCAARLHVDPFAALLPEIEIPADLRSEFNDWRRSTYGLGIDE